MAVAVAAVSVSVVSSTAVSAGSVERQASARRAFFGVNTFPLALVSDQDISLIHQSRIGSVRFFINWGLVEPSPGSHNWLQVDRMMGRLAREHLRPLALLSGLPTWVTPNDRPPLRGSAKRGWSRFLHVVVRRYGPHGSFWRAHPELPRDPLRELQVWNEPNFPSFWGGHPSARGYKKLLKASARAIRSVSPKVKIVLAGLGPALARRNQVPSWKFLNRLYKAGAKPYFDIAADHPYGGNVASMADQLRLVSKVMRRHHDHAPLYITELGWSSGHFSGSHLNVGLRGQAKRLRGAMRFAIRHRRSYRIKRFFWFQWRDQAPTPNGKFDFGLRRIDESPKPAWRAYVHFTGG